MVLTRHNHSATSPERQLKVIILEPTFLKDRHKEKSVDRINKLSKEGTCPWTYCTIAFLLLGPTFSSRNGHATIKPLIDIQEM
jgi:hypothetical protein